jgi:nucleoside-diphosphate-sugar epimerase
MKRLCNALTFAPLFKQSKNKKMKQTILGAGGVTANHLTDALLKRGETVRLVSRSAKAYTGVTDILSADLLNAKAVSDAVLGSDIVYLTAGLTYDIRVWQRDWPILMQNTIDACKQHNAKLVFFDNVYGYGKVEGTMTEKTPYNPTSKKGEVRAQIATKLMDETKAGNLNALIARAADFYGPATPLSILTAMVFENLAKGKSAQYFISDQIRHSFTYTPDMGKALADLAQDATAWNQIWHLPTANPAPTGKELIEMAAKEMGAKPKTMVLGKTMNRILGLFIPILREMHEMLYQYEVDYHFDSTKFDTHFGWKATPYTEGVRQTAQFYKG